MTKIPINLITGFLGAGKTSAIQSLLPHRPPSERWAILINEYGMVSLDHILVNDSESDLSGVHVDEMAGGCFCCSLSMELPLMLARMIRRTQPHRIILEPTGSGHPASVIDLLRSGRLAELLDLRATIALVDPRDYENPRITNSDVFHDQLQMADVVAINFTDKCDPEQIRRCRDWIESLDPPKLLITETRNGQLEPAWLDLAGHVVRPPKFTEAHDHQPFDHQSGHAKTNEPPVLVGLGGLQESMIGAPQQTAQVPAKGMPLRYENSGLGQSACGWIFSTDEVFDRDQIIDLLSGLNPVLRLKGIFRCEDDWWSIQRRGQDTRFQRSAWRRDSRVEIIISFESDGWAELEARILGCRVHP